MNQDDSEIEDDGFTELGEIDPLNDENISQEQINEMKMLGMDKPPKVSWARWQQLQGIRAEHEHMIHLAASGAPQAKIAESLGYDQASVSKILKTPEIRMRINEEIESIYGADHKKALKDRALKAIGVVDDVLTDGKENERATMARWVLEHSVGKASQDIHVTKTTLTEFMISIKQMEESNQLRNVSPTSEALQKPKDHFDTIIEEVIPKGMVIGKRGGSSGEGQTE
jgi:hypothetical protein